MTRTRDSQKQKLYTSERTAWDSSQRLSLYSDAQAFVDQVTTSNYWLKKVGSVKIKVTHSKSRRTSWYSGSQDRINLSVNHLHKAVLLHELAHAVIYHRITLVEPTREISDHGPEFAHVYLHLIKRFLGKSSKRKMAEAFQKARIRYIPSAAIL